MGLHNASKNGDVMTVYRLLKKGVDVNARNREDQTALHYASRNGHFKIVALLIWSNADINAQINGGATPLIFACMGGHVDIVRFMLICGANTNIDTIHSGGMGIAQTHGYTGEIGSLLNNV